MGRTKKITILEILRYAREGEFTPEEVAEKANSSVRYVYQVAATHDLAGKFGNRLFGVGYTDPWDDLPPHDLEAGRKGVKEAREVLARIRAEADGDIGTDITPEVELNVLSALGDDYLDYACERYGTKSGAQGWCDWASSEAVLMMANAGHSVCAYQLNRLDGDGEHSVAVTTIDGQRVVVDFTFRQFDVEAPVPYIESLPDYLDHHSFFVTEINPLPMESFVRQVVNEIKAGISSIPKEHIVDLLEEFLSSKWALSMSQAEVRNLRQITDALGSTL